MAFGLVRIRKKYRRFMSDLFPAIPRRVPAYVCFTSLSSSRSGKETRNKKIVLLKDRIFIETILNGTRSAEEHRIAEKDFLYFYKLLRRWRFDLIPQNYLHNLYNDYSTDRASSLILAFGRDEHKTKEIMVNSSRDYGIEGKELQKMELIMAMLERLYERSKP